jgi:hypothetical protein
MNKIVCVHAFQANGAMSPAPTPWSDLSLKELTEKFCKANEVQERQELAKRIRIILYCFSVNNTELCNVQLSERILRTNFSQNDQHSIEVRIGIYCLHLAVMLQRGLQPEIMNGDNNATVIALLDRLKNMVKPSVYYPTSSLRKDIENAIDMLSLYSANLHRHQTLLGKITKCFGQITSDSCYDENNVKSCLEKYLKARTWIHLYLIISWLKIKVLSPIL